MKKWVTIKRRDLQDLWCPRLLSLQKLINYIIKFVLSILKPSVCVHGEKKKKLWINLRLYIIVQSVFFFSNLWSRCVGSQASTRGLSQIKLHVQKYSTKVFQTCYIVWRHATTYCLNRYGDFSKILLIMWWAICFQRKPLKLVNKNWPCKWFLTRHE